MFQLNIKIFLLSDSYRLCVVELSDILRLHCPTGGDNEMQEKLIIARSRHKYTKIRVAKHLGISPKQYAAKEKGEYTFNSDEMFKLSELFKMKLDDLFTDTKNN